MSKKLPAIRNGFHCDQSGMKVAIVTGGATGIGLNICKGLCHFGLKVIIAGRNEGRARGAIAEILKETPTADVQFYYCDLSSFKSIKAFTTKFKQTGLPLHILINNAGVMLCPHWTTADGFEEHFGVNYMGHVYLTNLLMDTIKATGTSSLHARIVNITSEAYSVGTLNLRDLNSRYRYSSHAAYSQSKLALLMWTLKLQRELISQNNAYITVNAVHPGIVNTQLYRHINIFCRVAKFICGKLLKSPYQGAYPCVYTAVSMDLEGLGANYIRECEPVKTTTDSIDTTKQDQLWDVTHKMIAATEAGKTLF